MLHPNVWTEFTGRARCLGAVQRDFPEWRRGRRRYAVWTVDAEAAPVRERIAALRGNLGGFLVAPYARQAHVTVAVAGFLVPAAGHEDDVTPEVLGRQLQRLRALALPPFTLVVGGANSFASAPFLEVFDPDGALGRIRRALAPDLREFRTSPYVPHVTVGIYSGDHPISGVIPALTAGAGLAAPIPLRIDHLALCSYDATVMGSPLRVEQQLPFAEATDAKPV